MEGVFNFFSYLCTHATTFANDKNQSQTIKCTIMKHKLLLLILFLVTMITGARATVVNLADAKGDYTYVSPTVMFKNYSLVQQIYTAEEIGMVGTITHVFFYYWDSGNTGFSKEGVQLFMKQVDKALFSSDTDMVELTDEDKVFEGTFGASETGWIQITLDKSFEFDGTRNLLVAFYDPNEGSFGTSNKFYYIYTPGNMVLDYFDDALCPDLSDLSSYQGTKKRYTYRSGIAFNIEGTSTKPENVILYEGFGSGGEQTYPSGSASEILKVWSNLGSSSSPSYWKQVTSAADGLRPHSGGMFAHANRSGSKLVAPTLDLRSCEVATLRFFYANPKRGDNVSEFVVYIRPLIPNRTTTFEPIYQTTEAHDDWTEVVLNLPERYFQNDYQIAFSCTTGGSDYYGVAIDDVTIDDTPIPFPDNSVYNQALNVEDGILSFVAGGDYPWTVVSEDGGSYAQFDEYEKRNSVSTLSTEVEVTAPLELSFDYQLTGKGYFVCGVHEVELRKTNGWSSYSVELAPGTYTLSWETHDSNAPALFAIDNVKLSGAAIKHEVEEQMACDSYTWHGTTYTASGTYTYEAMNNEGQVADIYTLKLTIYQSTSEDKDATVYIGQHYTDKEYPDVFDFDVTAETPTTMYYTFTNAYGCDHAVTLNLTILDPGISIDEANFPDENFRNYIKEGTYYDMETKRYIMVDTNMDGYLSDDEAGASALMFSGKDVSNTKGIEYFTKLKQINCSGNKLAGTAVDELIAALPVRSEGDGIIHFEAAGYERVNRITAAQIEAAKAKGWTVMMEAMNGWVESIGLLLPLYFEWQSDEDTWEKLYLSEENFASFKELLQAKGRTAEGTLTYDKESHTLTMDGFKTNTSLQNDHQVYDRYYYEKDPVACTIVIKGENELAGFRNYYEKEVNIVGDGTLKSSSTIYLYANNVNYDGPTFEVNATGDEYTYGLRVDGDTEVNMTINSGTLRLTSTGLPIVVSVYHGTVTLTLDERVKVVEPEGAVQTTWGEGNDYAVIFADAEGNMLTNTTLVIETEPEPDNVIGVPAEVNGQSDAWYTLDGRRLQGKPTKKGFYIHNNRKTLVY